MKKQNTTTQEKEIAIQLSYYKRVPVKVNKPLNRALGKSRLCTDLGTLSIQVTISKV